MFSEPISYITSVFRGLVGNDSDNGESHELENKSRDTIQSGDITNPASLSAQTDDATTYTGKLQELNVSRLRETTFTRDTEYDERINEMLAEVTSRETGYSSESESYENISLNTEETGDDIFRNNSYILGNESGVRRRPAGGHRVLTADEVQIEYSKSRDSTSSHDVRDHRMETGKASQEGDAIEKKRGNDEGCPKSTDAFRRYQINEAFVDDDHDVDEAGMEAEDEIKPLPNIASISRLMTERKNNKTVAEETANGSLENSKDSVQTGAGKRRFSAAVEWQKVAASKSLLSSTRGTTSVISTNPIVASKLTESYQRAKKRMAKKKPSFHEVVVKVHVKKLGTKLRSFIDHHADKSYQYKKPKFYLHDSSSSDDDMAVRDPYSIVPRKKKWYEKKPKTGNERLMQSKFFGKKGISLN